MLSLSKAYSTTKLRYREPRGAHKNLLAARTLIDITFGPRQAKRESASACRAQALAKRWLSGRINTLCASPLTATPVSLRARAEGTLPSTTALYEPEKLLSRTV